MEIKVFFSGDDDNQIFSKEIGCNATILILHKLQIVIYEDEITKFTYNVIRNVNVLLNRQTK